MNDADINIVVATSGPTGGTLLHRPAWRYALVFSLYAYQGLVAGFSLTALPNHYAQLGLPVGEIGRHVALAGLPWTLQPLWGPVVDRVGHFRMGQRRGWIVLALAGSLAALCGLLLVPDPAAATLAVSLLFAAHSVAAALMDTATDALLIDRVPPAGLGRANACTRAGFVSGTALGAALFSALLPSAGFATVVAVLLGLGALASIMPLLVREQRGDAWLSLAGRGDAPHRTASPAELPARLPSWPRTARRLASLLARPRSLRLLGLCFALNFAVAVFQVPFAVSLIRDEGWDPAALSRVQGALALVSGTGGALAVGLLADRHGAPRVLSWLLAAVAGLFALTAGLVAAGAAAAVGPLVLGLTVVMPVLFFSALAPTVMRASRGAMAATRFAVFMAALNGGDVAGAAAAGAVYGVLGSDGTALAAAAVFAAGAIMARWRGMLTRAEGAGRSARGR